jgi:hypothetical protein
MLGPADLEDWTYDERDMVCAALRRHDSIHAVVMGADQSAGGFPDHLRAQVCRFAAQDDMFAKISARLALGPIACVFIDEAQFLTKPQVWQLARAVDDLGVPVMAYGLRVDFQGNLFPGSAALLAWADDYSGAPGASPLVGARASGRVAQLFKDRGRPSSSSPENVPSCNVTPLAGDNR